MRICVKPVVNHTPTIRVRCISKKCGNFEYNKIYTAEAGGKLKTLYTDFKIKDEDGDYFTIHEDDLGRLFLIIPEYSPKNGE